VRVGDLKPLRTEDLDLAERRVFTACEDALRRADSRHTFIEHFWNVMPRATRGGARCDVALGAQYGNRTGVVQGGLLFGIAAATAQAAAPRHPQISNISAWYIGPGSGDRLIVRSRPIHAGRSFAVVRTEIARPDGARVLETVSHHAA
jgi:acyl-coenzyme A thioesterase PaaI-like protein